MKRNSILKGEAPLNVRKKRKMNQKGENKMANASGNYTVVVDGQRFNVTIENGNANIQSNTSTSGTTSSSTTSCYSCTCCTK